LRLDVAATPALLRAEVVAASTVLVIDVLRASTTIVTALTSGCVGIVPVADAEEARRRAQAAPGALIAGERRGEPLQGFDLGNSPLEFTPARVGGRTVVFTTSNGTKALVAVRAAPAVGVAAFVNLAAAAAWALAGRRDILLVCAGERGAESLEDLVCAGLLVDRIVTAEPAATPTPVAQRARELGRGYAKDIGRLRDDSRWARHLAKGRGGDVAACLALDCSTLVPIYLPDVDKVVSGPR
jgi:2-phosphosulfolactate phosphatase